VHVIGQEVCKIVNYQGSLMRDHPLGLVFLVPTPEGQPDELVMLSYGHSWKAVEPVRHTLKVANSLVIVEVAVPVTY
jgi:hypothetical protein